MKLIFGIIAFFCIGFSLAACNETKSTHSRPVYTTKVHEYCVNGKQMFRKDAYEGLVYTGQCEGNYYKIHKLERIEN